MHFWYIYLTVFILLLKNVNLYEIGNFEKILFAETNISFSQVNVSFINWRSKLIWLQYSFFCYQVRMRGEPLTASDWNSILGIGA